MTRKLISSIILLCVLPVGATFLPESDIRYDKLTTGPSQINEKQFNDLIRQVQTAYQDIVRDQGGKLRISGSWNSDKLNAGATQLFGSWNVQISGALARRPELTADGFTLILCHELGHHLGGYSFSRQGFPIGGVWAANEGEADYFASQACARKLWAQETDLNQEFAKKVSEYAKAKCDQAWTRETEKALCYRVSAAADSIGQTMAGITNKPVPRFETPDTKVVNQTSDDHPEPQCRVDTSFQAALCAVNFDERVIPGKKVNGGPHSRAAEEEAARYSCMDKNSFGARPGCWFKSQL